MVRPSELLAKLENIITDKFGDKAKRLAQKAKKHALLLLLGVYLYGMVINSVRRGIDSVFGSAPPEGIWVLNPIKNLIAIFTPTGLIVTAVGVLLFCLITKRGYKWFSGYKYTHDPRGFDILPDGTHGTSGFMSAAEMKEVISLERIEDAEETVVGKISNSGGTAKYATVRDTGAYKNHAHTIVLGATGSGKTQGYIIPFLLQAVKRGESVIVVDPKSELYEKTSEYIRREKGYTTKIFNLLDTESSDAWNPFEAIQSDASLVDAIAETIIKNTSNISERQDFWESATRS